MAEENARWVVHPLEIAKQHPLYGVGGWLTLVILGSVVAPIRIVFSIGPLYRDVDFAALPGALAAFIAVEMAVNTAIVLWSIGNLFLLFRKNPLFPASFASLMGVSAVFVTADTLAIGPIMEAIGQPMTTAEIFDSESVREMGRAIIGAAIWIPYAIVSRRVNVTYRNRVRPDDPLIQKSTAAVF